MNALSQSSFEGTLTAWTLTGSASVSSAYPAYDGSSVLTLFAARLTLGPVVASSDAAQGMVSVNPGEPYTLSVPCNGDLGVSGITLRLTITDGGTDTVYSLSAPLGSGWQVWNPGTYTPSNSSVTWKLTTPIPALGKSGTWLVDAVSMESDDMTRRREIRDAIVARISAIAGVGECVAGAQTQQNIEATPHVEVTIQSESKEVGRILTRKECTVQFRVEVLAEDDGDTPAADVADDICGLIENALELNDDGAGHNRPYLDLGYITEVNAQSETVVEDTAEEVTRGTAKIVTTVTVTYRHDRRNP